jgi:hypothetical protein
VAIILVYFVVGGATLVCGIWSIIDAAGRPDHAFRAADTSKALWITLVAVGSVLCGPIGLIFSLIYLLSIRRKVMAAQAAMPAVAYGVSMSPPMATTVGWYPDPTNPTIEWFWDGRQYTGSRTRTPPPPPPGTFPS